MNAGSPSIAGDAGRERWLIACAAVVLFGLALHLPSFSWGFFCDDYSHQLVLDGRLSSKTLAPWSLYDFGTWSDADAATKESGGFPFWTDPDFKLRFFRPVASVALWLDHALFGQPAAGYHASSLVWYAACLSALIALYRALELTRGQALLAGLVFACDNGTAVPVGWIANRNSVLELLFTVLAVATVARGRLGAPRLALAASFALLAAGSKESGACAFVLAGIALALRARRREADAALARRAAGAFVASGGLYLGALLAAGYGSTSLFYPTPWGAPLDYAHNFVGLACFTPLAMFAPLPIDLFVVTPGIYWVGALAALAVGAVLAAAAWRSVRHHPWAPLFAAWIAVELLPQGGTLSSDRLLFGPMAGGAAIVALFLSDVLPRARRAAPPRFVRALARVVAVTSIPLSASFVIAGGVQLAGVSKEMRRILTTADVGDPSLGRREAIVLQSSPHALMTLAPLSTWAVETGDAEVRFRPVQGGVRALRWRRESENACTFQSRDEPFLELPFERLFRTHDDAPSAGSSWTSGPITFRVAAVDERGVRALSLEAPGSLDDPRYRFLVPSAGRWVHQPPPRVGESLDLPRAPKDATMP
jgi:hypothetical protein